MKNLAGIIPLILYGMVGIISLIMAFKGLFSDRFISFHEKASAKSWDEIDKPLQAVILAITKISGLGFLVTAILLLALPAAGYLAHNRFTALFGPAVSLVFCTGLFFVNYSLHKKTQADTPWKGSLVAMIVIAAGMVIASL
jgi:hypothetical protein